MIRNFIRCGIVLLVTTAFIADTSYLFCLESDNTHNYPVNNIINAMHKEHNHSESSHNHHNPFHHINHSSQLTPSADFCLNDFNTSFHYLPELPVETIKANLLHNNNPQFLYLLQKFRSCSLRNNLEMLTVLLI